jgi:hypothetical protein
MMNAGFHHGGEECHSHVSGIRLLGGVYIAMTSYSVYIHLYIHPWILLEIHGYKYLLR